MHRSPRLARHGSTPPSMLASRRPSPSRARAILLALCAAGSALAGPCPLGFASPRAPTDEELSAFGRRLQAGTTCGTPFCYGSIAPDLPAFNLPWAELVNVTLPSSRSAAYMEDSARRQRTIVGSFNMNQRRPNRRRSEGAAGYTVRAVRLRTPPMLARARSDRRAMTTDTHPLLPPPPLLGRSGARSTSASSSRTTSTWTFSRGSASPSIRRRCQT
jgi:hypothetical protein